MILRSIITRPNCGTAKAKTMPTDACQFLYGCNGCGAAQAKSRRLLCVLLLWRRAVPSDSGVSHELRADKSLRRVAGHDERQRETGCRLARDRPHQRIGVVAPRMRHACRAIRCNAGTYGELDRCASVDGDSLHPECPALRANALSIYGTVLSRHDSSGARVWRGHRPVRLLRMACARSRHSSRKQGHLVGDGACMGEVLLVREAIMDS